MVLLQDLADERNFGPEAGRDWQQVDRFSPEPRGLETPITPYAQVQPEIVASARAEVEQAFVTAQHKLEEDKY